MLWLRGPLEMQVLPTNYLVHEEKDIHCLAIKPSVEDMVVLGIPFLLNKRVIVQGEHWFIAASKCPKVDRPRDSSRLSQFYAPAMAYFTAFFLLMQAACCVIAYRCDKLPSLLLNA